MMKNFRELSNQLREQDDTTEKNEMASTQAHFIKYAAEEILEYIEMGGKIEEWYQNKLSKVHSDMEGLHSWMEGEKRRTNMVDEASSAYGRINARFKKLSGGSLEDTAAKHRKEAERLQKEIDAQQAENERRKAAMKTEEVELDEENKPTNPELWSRAKALAKSKFDVYPSAYANGWAAKKYKEMGGGWKSVSEEVKKDDLPFKADKPMKKSVVTGKKPEGYSIARHLARQAMQKYMKKPVKEENMSKKTKIVKDTMKKSSDDDKFQAEPMISQSIIRNN